MTSSKVYYRKGIDGKIWCYGYHNGANWRVFNTSPDINEWFEWMAGDPVRGGLFSSEDYIKVNNFREKAKC